MTTDMSKLTHNRLYNSVYDCFRKANSSAILNSVNESNLSIKNIYKGYSLALLGTLPYTALSLPIYNYVNTLLNISIDDFQLMNSYFKVILKFGPSTSILLLFSVFLYPIETGKKLMQVNGSLGYEKPYESISDMFKSNSTKNLYKGYTMHLLKLTPFTFLQFSIYELLKSLHT